METIKAAGTLQTPAPASVVIDSLPRNTMGKVQKNVLRDAYKDMFATT